MIAVLMAAYNEAPRLGALLARMPATIGGETVEVIVVCDGSTDGTCAEAARHNCIVVALGNNRGKWFAVRQGLAVASKRGATMVVTMDSDGQHEPEVLAEIVRPVAHGRADMAIGSRYLVDQGRGNTPRNRYVVRTSTIAILEKLVGNRYTDPFSGYRCFSAEALQQIVFKGDRYEGELEAILEASRLGLKVSEVPIARIYDTNTSKMGAHKGKLLGRLSVLHQYGKTMARYVSPPSWPSRTAHTGQPT